MCMKALAGLFGGGSSRSTAPAAPPPGQAIAPVDTTAAAKPNVAAPAATEVGSTDGADAVGIGNSLSQNTRTKRAAVPGLGL